MSRDWTAIEVGLRDNERIAALATDFSRWVYAMCLLSADSHGCIEDRPNALLHVLVPLLHRPVEEMDAALWDLARVGLIERREGNGRRWIALCKWSDKAASRQIRRLGKTPWPTQSVVRQEPVVTPGLVPECTGLVPDGAGPVPYTPPTRARALSCPVSPVETSTPQVESPQKGATRPARAERGPSKGDALADRPVGIPAEAWTAWVEHQWARKRPTPTALDQHRRKLAALGEARGQAAAIAFIDQCIGANAQGIPDWAYDAAMKPKPSSALPFGRAANPAAQREAEHAAVLDRVFGSNEPKL